MKKTASHVLAVGSLACLLVLPHSRTATAGRIRDEAVAYRREGFERQQRGDIEGAIAAYQKAVSVDPSYATPFNDLGILYEQSEEFGLAEQAYQQALVVDPNYLGAHANLALLYERLGQQEQAVFHWLKRYQLGAPDDSWTIHAEERLQALGVLKTHPGIKKQAVTHRRTMAKELDAFEQELDDFRAVTDEHWQGPARLSEQRKTP